ncbi:MAG: thioredoxin [Candidatus Nanohaloarchaea archaeon]
MPTSIDSEKMEEIQGSDQTWVIDFWADWCAPCKKYAPQFKEAAEELETVEFGKVDMEENQQIGTQLGVRSLPTTLIIRNGEEVARKSGVLKKDELVSWIKENA